MLASPWKSYRLEGHRRTLLEDPSPSEAIPENPPLHPPHRPPLGVAAAEAPSRTWLAGQNGRGQTSESQAGVGLVVVVGGEIATMRGSRDKQVVRVLLDDYMGLCG